MDSKDFIDGLKRDKARGNLAPHQILLLITMCNIYNEHKSSFIDIVALNNEFQKVWLDHKKEFITKNNKIGLPLKAFLNREYIELEIEGSINDFRNIAELESKILKLKVSDILIDLIKKDNVKNYLISRIKA